MLWDYDFQPQYTIDVDDKQARYDIFVNIRHNAYYPYHNLFLLLHEKGKGLRDTAFRYELQLAEDEGKWLGNSAGNLYEQSALVKENVSFPDTGKYTLSLEHNMHENPLRGINDVGIKIIKK